MNAFRAKGGRSYYLRILVLFAFAALVPVLLLSALLTSIAESALRRAMDERGRAAVWAFAERVSALERGADLSLASIVASAETKLVLAYAEAPPAEAASSVQRILAREAARSPGLAFSLADASGTRGYATKDLPFDASLPVYERWGIARKAAAAPGSTVVSARRRVASDGSVALVVAARLVLSPEGRVLGIALAEIFREAFVGAAGEDREFLGADAELIDRNGLVAFSLADPSREGLGEEEAPFAPLAARGAYRAESGVFSVRLALPEALLADLGKAMRAATNAGLGAAAAIAALFALVASRIVTRPVLALSASMKRVRAGDLAVRVKPASKDELGELAESFNAMTAEIGELVAAAVERRELLRKAELGALAARMNPHFLRNSLNSVKSLAKLGRTAEVAEMATRLGKLLGSEARGRSELSTVREGLEFARHYLFVERSRFGERLVVVEDINPGLFDLPLPSLIIEPLVENALIHGLEAVSGPWTMRIEGGIEAVESYRENLGGFGGVDGDGEGGTETLSERRALIVVEDDGPGVAPERLEELTRSLAAGEAPEGESHLGLAATNRRLRLHYGPGYGIVVSEARNASQSARLEGRPGFRAELRFPAGAAAPGAAAPGAAAPGAAAPGAAAPGAAAPGAATAAEA